MLNSSRRKSLGAGLLTTLLFASVILVIVYAVAEVFIRFTFFEQRMHVRRYSSIAAESAAATAAAQLKMDNAFGRDVKKDRIEIKDGDLGPYQTAYVQFDPNSGQPYSVNNLSSDAVVPGFRGTPVPAYGAQIIGVGHYGGKDSLFEIILTRPGITHAAASSGKLVLDGHNEAASLKTQEQLNQMTDGTLVNSATLEEEARNTTVASGGKSGKPLELKGDLTLYGDAISASGIEQDGTVRFLHGGGPRTNDSSVEIPTIDDITVYDPKALAGTTDLNPSYSDATNLFQGRNRCQGDLVINGDLDLDGALLYVTGNLTVNGNIKGEGALVTLGSMTLTGHSSLQADSKVALISKGDLSLTGTDADHSLFSGLIYSEGKVNASRITVVGGLVANNPTNPEAASMEVTDTRLVNLPEKTKFDISKVVKAPPLPKPGGGLFLKLNQYHLELVNPDLGLLIGPNSTWNGVAPSFRFKDTKTGAIYSGLSAVPGLDPATLEDIETKLRYFITVDWTPFLGTLSPQNVQVENIFQLDPNQLLTVSGGYKVLLRRSLEG